MGWFQDQGYDPYEPGGFTGGQSPQVEPTTTETPDEPVNDPNYMAWKRQNPNVPFAQSPWATGQGSAGATTQAAPQTPAFDPSQQVGHNGSINGLTREQYRDQWFGKGDVTLADLQNYVKQYGGTILNPKNGTVRTPFGEELDMVQGLSDDGRGKAAWGGVGPSAGPSPAPSGGGAPLGAIGSGGFNYTPPPAASTVGQSGHLGGSFSPFVYEDFKAPDPFKAPTAADMTDDPGYQFRLAQGQRAITNAASRGGALASGAFVKGMTDYNSGAASQEYGNVYGRRASEYDRAYGNAFGANQANNAGRLGAFTANTNADLGYGNLDNARNQTANSYNLGMANVGLGYHQADQGYDLGLRNNALGYYTADQNYSLGQGQQQLGWANYGLNAQGQNFNQQYSLANLGLGAIGQAGQYGSSYANGMGGYTTGAGNARAAGQAGASGVYGNTLGNLGGYGIGYGLYQGMNGRGNPGAMAGGNMQGLF